MKALHGTWVWVALISTGGIGLWGVGVALLRRTPGRAFRIAAACAVAAMLIQIGLGFLTLAQGHEPDNEFHLFYGFVILFTLAFAYIFRAQVARRPALPWGLILLFVMGLGIRAWANVGG
jgi:hypothetical protein